MPKGYWIGHVDVHDVDAYQKYAEGNGTALYGAKFLVRGGQFENPEGSSRSRNIVLEFDSYEQALACYNSDEYQKVLKLRTAPGVADADIIIIEGYDG